jgi:Flp pilus assembly protein TadG
MAKQHYQAKGFLTRLARNQAGNAMAMTAAALVPMLGLIGGGIDMSRLYLVKARLQQACDAGALAGRKQMAGGAWSYNSYQARTAAENMFKANFLENSYGTNSLSRSFSESSGKVTGTASVQVPMAVMQVFGIRNKTIGVTCDADMRIPNTDVMFVLDVTGSMGDTNSGDTAPKIDGLKRAVRCFYEALAKKNTIADCGSTPSGNSGSAQLRFGFVPYNTNVNVGRLLRNDWMADSWNYQSREWSGGKWVYRQRSFNISGLKAGGSSWNNSVKLPLGNSGGNTSISWDGCIEERKTAITTNFDPIPTDAWDLNIDMMPSTGDPDTQWKPALKDAIWGRQSPSYNFTGYSGNTLDDVNGDSSVNMPRNYSYACPPAAARLAIYNNASDFDTYVNTLVEGGNTYHDIGLIWGARLISPTGLFASDNAFTPTGGEIERHVIFMTDGDTVTGAENYTAYGVAWWDRRQTPVGTIPTSSLLNAQVNARFQAVCKYIKNVMQVHLWVVSFGSGVSGSAQTALKNCAETNRYFLAKNSTELNQQFQQIADEISQLRLTN